MAKKRRNPPAVVTDKRFEKVHTDPRFRRLPRKTKQVEIDDRFAGVVFSSGKFLSSQRNVQSCGRNVLLPKCASLLRPNLFKFGRLCNMKLLCDGCNRPCSHHNSGTKVKIFSADVVTFSLVRSRGIRWWLEAPTKSSTFPTTWHSRDNSDKTHSDCNIDTTSWWRA